VLQAGARLEVTDGGLDLGVAAVVGLQLQGAAGPVGDERVIVIGAEQGQLAARVGRTRRTINRVGVPFFPNGR
jgi:hypothetical protein